jgi:hypothetical protein
LEKKVEFEEIDDGTFDTIKSAIKEVNSIPIKVGGKSRRVAIFKKWLEGKGVFSDVAIRRLLAKYETMINANP